MLSDKATFWIRVGVAILIILGAFLVGYLFPSSAQGTEFSAGMEDGFYTYQGWLYEIAEPMAPGWAPPEEPDFAGVPNLKRPEFQRSSFAHSGSLSQVLKNVWSVGEGGLWADVWVGAGNRVMLGAWFYGWSSSGDDFGQSVGGSMQFRVGIAANGETNWYRDDTIVWNETHSFVGNTTKDLDRWTYREVSAIAQADVVRIWAWQRSEWPLKHNDCYIDDITVMVSEGPALTPTPTLSTPTVQPTLPHPSPTQPGPTVTPLPIQTQTPSPTERQSTPTAAGPMQTPIITPGPFCILNRDEARILEAFLRWLLAR